MVRKIYRRHIKTKDLKNKKADEMAYLGDGAGANGKEAVDWVVDLVSRAGKVDTRRLNQPADSGKHRNTSVLKLCKNREGRDLKIGRK